MWLYIFSVNKLNPRAYLNSIIMKQLVHILYVFFKLVRFMVYILSELETYFLNLWTIQYWLMCVSEKRKHWNFFLIFIFPNFLRNATDFLINLYKKMNFYLWCKSERLISLHFVFCDKSVIHIISCSVMIFICRLN